MQLLLWLLRPHFCLFLCRITPIRNIVAAQEQLEAYGDDDYLLIDCPGQIELYSHIPVMKRCAR